MKLDIIRIGNSQGIRIPAAILKQLGLTKQVEMTVKSGGMVLKKPAVRAKKKSNPRAGWDDEAKWLGGHELTDEEREWLDAPLTDLTDDELV